MAPGTGDIVIMDNLGSHKVAGVREAIEAVEQALLYLPSYIPELSPIEHFAKLKALLRAKAMRTVEAPAKRWAACLIVSHPPSVPPSCDTPGVCSWPERALGCSRWFPERGLKGNAVQSRGCPRNC